ncbi:MAG: response regulator receiver protein, partial [Desulfacinum sp.]|nr:response regulator receiver protein [Desulfacinum sp.]
MRSVSFRIGKDSCGWERGSDSTGSTPTNASPFSTTAATPTGRELLFGGIRGFNAFFPERIRENPYKPPVVLTDLLIFNRPVRIGDASPLQQSLPSTQKIVLTHEQSVVSFRFSALNFHAPEKNRYAYKLEGLDKDWNHVDSSRRFATYAHFPPGRYVFRINAANNDGVWNEEGAALAVEVKPA